jgi:pantothenate synthetase
MTGMCLWSGKRKADGKVVVSNFVNPTRFAPTEDFGSYPRTWKADVAKLAAERVDPIRHPDVKTMYPEEFATRIVPEGLAAAGLEDRFRPPGSRSTISKSAMPRRSRRAARSGKVRCAYWLQPAWQHAPDR